MKIDKKIVLNKAFDLFESQNCTVIDSTNSVVDNEEDGFWVDCTRYIPYKEFEKP